MKKYTFLICTLLLLALLTTAFAAPAHKAKIKWWPGEKPTPRAAGSLAGQITAITATTLTVQTEKYGAPIFTLNANTVVTGAKTSVDTLTVGDKVIVTYTTLPDDNVWAKVVNVPKTGAPPAIKVSMVFGKITAVSATSISILTSEHGQQDYTVTDKTEVKVLGQKSTIDQVKTGPNAIVAYTVTGSGSVARGIRVLADGIGPNLSGMVVGKISAIGPTGITILTEKEGSQQLSFTERTRFRIYDQPVTIDQFKVGDNVHVGFIILDDGNRVASVVAVPIPTFSGRITSVGTNSFVLTTKTGPVNVTVGPDTKVAAHTYIGGIADLKVGYGASVRGIPGASAVDALTITFSAPVIKGVVQSTAGDTIVVKTEKRIFNVTGGAGTVILVRPRTAPNYTGTPADVKPGTAVNIGGHITGRGAMAALWIDLLIP